MLNKLSVEVVSATRTLQPGANVKYLHRRVSQALHLFSRMSARAARLTFDFSRAANAAGRQSVSPRIWWNSWAQAWSRSSRRCSMAALATSASRLSNRKMVNATPVPHRGSVRLAPSEAEPSGSALYPLRSHKVIMQQRLTLACNAMGEASHTHRRCHELTRPHYRGMAITSIGNISRGCLLAMPSASRCFH
jgi:hypothetical protein